MLAFKIQFCLRTSNIITGGREFAPSRCVILSSKLLNTLMLMISLQSLETLTHSVKLWLPVSTWEMWTSIKPTEQGVSTLKG